MDKLSKPAILENLDLLEKGWTYSDEFIQKEFIFKDFVQAFSFMTAIASEAEKMNHHPNWENVYNKVNIALNTHDVAGVSLKDFELAAHIDLISKNFTN